MSLIKIRVLGFTFIFLLLAASIQAQQNKVFKSYLAIDSNFDSLYVMVDGQSETMQKVGVQELIEVREGKHEITVVPQYAQSFAFTIDFIADSIHFATIQFKEILNEVNPEFRGIQEELSSGFSLSQNNFGSLRGTLRIDTYSKEVFENKAYRQTDYQGTYLKISSNVDSLYVRPNAYLERTIRIANNDSVLIQPGIRRIVLSHQQAEEWISTINIKAGTTRHIKHDFEIRETSYETLSNNIATKEYYDANLIIISDWDSDIIVDGSSVGRAAAKVRQGTGPVNIEVRNPETGTHSYFEKVANLPPDRATVVGAYTRPSQKSARILSFLPGASQLYKKQKVKGYALLVGFLGLGGISFIHNSAYRDELATYRVMEDRYENADTQQEALELGNMLEEQHGFVKRQDNLRTAFISSTLLLYTINIADGLFIKPSAGYRKKTDVKLYLNSKRVSHQTHATVSVRYDF